MAYADAQQNARAKMGSMLVVGGIHAAVGLGLMAALSVTVLIPEPEERMDGFHLPVPPPPTPEPIEKTAEPDIPTTTFTAPIPDTVLTPEPDFTVAVAPDKPSLDVIRVPTPKTDPIALPPRPTPTFTPTVPIPRNGPQGWITTSDYPGSELRRGNEGTARYRVVVNSEGRVDACEITASTGHPKLDSATCRHIERRARFDPAQNAEAKPIVGSYSGVVTWNIPE